MYIGQWTMDNGQLSEVRDDAQMLRHRLLQCTWASGQWTALRSVRRCSVHLTTVDVEAQALAVIPGDFKNYRIAVCVYNIHIGYHICIVYSYLRSGVCREMTC